MRSKNYKLSPGNPAPFIPGIVRDSLRTLGADAVMLLYRIHRGLIFKKNNQPTA
jgi:hypothetical protein